jgi:hypothetical protein
MKEKYKDDMLQLVTSEQAKKLAKLGFSLQVDYYFRPHNDTPFHSDRRHDFNECSSDIGDYQYSAPTIALAMVWLREKLDIHGYVDRNPSGWYYVVSDWYEKGTITYKIQSNKNCIDEYESYDTAEIALLDEILKLMEQK